jgi:hypothetical protein
MTEERSVTKFEWSLVTFRGPHFVIVFPRASLRSPELVEKATDLEVTCQKLQNDFRVPGLTANGGFHVTYSDTLLRDKGKEKDSVHNLLSRAGRSGGGAGGEAQVVEHLLCNRVQTPVLPKKNKKQIVGEGRKG